MSKNTRDSRDIVNMIHDCDYKRESCLTCNLDQWKYSDADSHCYRCKHEKPGQSESFYTPTGWFLEIDRLRARVAELEEQVDALLETKRGDD